MFTYVSVHPKRILVVSVLLDPVIRCKAHTYRDESDEAVNTQDNEDVPFSLAVRPRQGFLKGQESRTL